MAENLGCSFCEQLPFLARTGRGRAGKCPICKQDLWESSDGRAYRFDANGAPRRGNGIVLFGMAMSVAFLICIVAGAIAFWPRERPVHTSLPEPVIPQPVVAPSPPAPRNAVVPQLVQATPITEVKPGVPEDAVRVKSPAPRVVDTRGTFKPAEIEYAQEVAIVKGPIRNVPTEISLSIVATRDEVLQTLLLQVPQVDLDRDYAKKSKADLDVAAKKIIESTKKDADAFVLDLKKNRADLAGLPFLMGKDCTISKGEAQALFNNSTVIRNALDEANSIVRPRSSTRPTEMNSHGHETAASYFWSRFDDRSLSAKPNPTIIPAFRQMMPVEHFGHRQRLVSFLQKQTDTKAATTLMEMAVFDVDADVRKLAVEALRERPTTAYRESLVKAMRYPFSPFARNAAQAIVSLDLKEAISELAAMLDEPDPRAPFEVKKVGEEPKTVVRELVRVNHQRNCMLCHAPVGEVTNDLARSLRDVPIGPVTAAGDPLPSGPSRMYYAPLKGITVVRADVTYLRQDFSVRQKVEDAGKWPEMQRFDFFVRLTELTEKEAAARKPGPGVSDFHATVASALYGLTGQARGLTRAAWQVEVSRAKWGPTPHP